MEVKIFLTSKKQEYIWNVKMAEEHGGMCDALEGSRSPFYGQGDNIMVKEEMQYSGSRILQFWGSNLNFPVLFHNI